MKLRYILLFCAVVVYVQAQDVEEQTTLIRVRRNAQNCLNSFFDFYFLIDLPSTMTQRNLNIVRTYVSDMIEGLRLAPNRARVSITSFGIQITNRGTLNEIQSRQNATEALDQIRLERGGDKVLPIQAIDYMINNSFTAEHGYRSQEDSVCVLIFATRFAEDANKTDAGRRLQQFCRVTAVGLAAASSRTNRIYDVTSGRGQTITSRRIPDLIRRVDSTLRIICRRPLFAPRTETVRTTTTTATVRWIPTPFASSYRASIRVLGETRDVQVFNNIPASQNEVTFTKLREATEYSVAVSVLESDGRQSPSASIILITRLAVPTIQLVEGTVTNSSATVTWRSVGSSSDINYFVTISVDDAGRTENNSYGFLTSGTRASLSDLLPGRRHNVSVATVFRRLRSDNSEPVVFTTIPGAPIIRLSRVRHIAMVVTWDEVPGAIAYDVVLRDLQTQEERRFFNLTKRTLMIDNLIPSMRYELKATAIGEENKRSGISSPLEVVTAPSNPDDVRTTRVTTNSIAFEWSAQPAALGYKVSVTSEQHRGYRVQASTNNLRFVIDRATPGAFYRIVVFSVGLNDVTDANVIFPLLAQTTPVAPRGLQISRVASESIEVSWSRSHGARTFHVTAEKVEDDTLTGIITRTTNTSEFAALVPDLEPGAMYEFKVTTEAIQSGTSGPSRAIRDSTYAAIPPIPRSISANTTFITIETDPAAGATSYLLSVKSVAGIGRFVAPVNREVEISAISGSFNIENLASGVWYNISLKSVNRFDKVNPLQSPALIDQTVPLPPFGGNFLNILTTSLEFTWREASGASAYAVIVTSDDFDDEFTEEFFMEYIVTNTSLQITDLRPGTVYRFTLQSIGNRDRRSRRSFSLFQQTAPGSPQNVHQLSVTASSVRLEWEATKGASTYRVHVQSNETDERPSVFTARTTQLTVSNLRGGTWYTFTVFSRDSRRRENPIGSEEFYAQTVPSPPINIEATQATVNSYLIMWDASSGAQGYQVRAFTSDNNVNTKVRTVQVRDETQVLMDNLDPGTLYQFFVSAIGFQEQISEESEPTADTTLPTAPDQPLVDRVTSTSITVSWNRVKGAVRYTVMVIQDIENNVTTQELNTNSNDIEVVNLIAGGWYNFTVISIGRRNRKNLQESVTLRVQTVPLAPISIDFDDFTTTSVRLGWNSVTGAGGYGVAARNPDTNEVVTELETEVTSAVLRGLSPGTAYRFEVATIGEDGDRRSRTTVTSREETNPAPPERPTALEVTDEHIQLRWNRVKGARRYIVTVESRERNENQTLEVSENSAIAHGLQPGILYLCKVYSVGVRSRRNPVPSESITVYTAPSPPTGIRTAEVGTTSMMLIWNPVQGALRYMVSLVQYERHVRSSERTLEPLTQGEALVEDLEPGTEYEFIIQAIGNEDRSSVPHPEFRDATLPNIPATPTVTAVFTTSIRYSWPRTSGAHRYRIFVSRGDEEASELSSANPTYVLTDLDAGTRYSFHTQAVGALDRLSERASDIVTQQTITEPPQQFVVTSTRSDSISLNWESAVGAESYSLTIRSESDGETVRIIQGTSIDLSDLTSGTSYHFQLRSVGDNGVLSDDFAELEETTLPDAPRNIRIESVSSSAIRLNWPNIKGALTYQVRVDTDSVFSTPLSDIILENLESGTFHAVQIFSVGIENRLSEEGSDVINIQTNPSPPEFRVTTVTTASISITWDEVVGASSYTFQVEAITSGISGDIEDLETENANLVIAGLQPGVEYAIIGFAHGEQRGRTSDQYELADSTLPSRPDGLQIDLVTSTTIQVSWRRQRGALAYLVEVDGNSEPVRTEDNVYRGENLTPGTFFDVVVYSVGEKERKNIEGSTTLRVQTASGAATNFVVTEETIDSIALSWDDVVGRSEFEIIVTTVRNPGELDLPAAFRASLPLSYRTEETAKTVSDLHPGVEYLFSLKAFGQQGQLSNEESNVIGVTFPTVPQSLSEVEATTTSITITWEASEGALTYEITMKNDDSEAASSYVTEETSFTVTSLTSGGFYDFTVFAIGTRSRKNPTGSETLSLQTVPLPPSNVRVVSTTTTEIELRWEDVRGRRSFSVEVAAMDTDNAASNTITTRDTTITIIGLRPGIPYRIRVHTIAMQAPKISVVVTIQKSTVSATPGQVQIRGVTTTSVTLVWNPVIGVIAYIVEVTRTDAAGDVITLRVSLTQAIIEDLVSGGTYSFVVFSVGVGNVQNRVGSPAITRQTITLPPSEAITESITVSSFVARWNAVFGATSYNVYVHEINNDESELVTRIPVEETSAIVTSLKSGTYYRIEIRSVNERDVESTGLTELNMVTLPATIEEPSVVEVSTDSIALEWESVKGAVRYLVETTREDPAVPREDDVTTEETSEANYVASNLLSGASYRFVIFSVGAENARNNEGSLVVSQQTVTLPPSEATIDGITVTSFTIRWSRVFGALSYNVYLYEANSENSPPSRIISVEDLSTEMTSLNSGTSYRVEIRSVGEHEVESAESFAVEATTLPDTLDIPTIVDVTTTSITLQWSPTVGAVHYIVETRQTDGDILEDATTEVSVELLYVAEDLIPGATYQFVVFSVGAGNVVNQNGSPAVIKQTVPLPPSVVTAENATETTLDLIWTEVFGAAMYNVYVYQVVEEELELFTTDTVSTVNHTVTSLSPGLEYRTRIRSAGIDAQESDDSGQAVTATKPEAVSSITTFNTQTDSIDIEWNEAAGAQRYMITVRNLEENLETHIDARVATMTVFGLMPGTFYEFQVTSIGALSVSNFNGSVAARAQTVPLPPDDVRISDITTTSFRVNWNPAHGAASYAVFLTSLVEDEFRDISTEDNSITISDLAPGTPYLITVLSTGQESQQSDLTDTVQETTRPDTPIIQDFSNVTTTAVTLLWNPVRGAVTYEVVYRVRGSNSATETQESATPETEISDLEAGTWYVFNVFSVGVKRRRNEIGSETIEVQTVPLPPDVVVINNVRDTSVVVTWNAARGAASYSLTYQTAINGEPTTIATASTRQEIAGLLTGTTYTFAVVSIGEEGQISDLSQEAEKTTLPATPRNVQVTDISTRTAELTWTEERGAIAYRVAVRNVAANTTVNTLSTLPATTIRNLFPGLTYEFTVFSIGIEERINRQGSESVTRQTVPRSPTRIEALESEINALLISWQAVTGAESYYVEVTSPDEDAFLPDAITTTQTLVTFRSLSSGTVYSFSVTAIGEEGQRSEPGQAVSQTVLPGKPIRVRAITTTTTSISLEWQEVKGALRYRIAATNEDTRELQESESERTRTEITSLLPGNTYQIIIFSISTDEKINPEGSDPLVKQTLTRPPNGVRLSGTTTTSVLVTWQSVTGAQNYVVTATSNDADVLIPTEITTSLLSIVVPSLSSGTTYTFTVRAINNEDRSSRPSIAAVETTLPDSPGTVSVGEVETSSIALSWPQVKGAIRYRVQLVNDETNDERIVTVSAERALLDELETGSWYEIVIFSVGRNQRNERGSEVIRIQTVPLAPNNVQAEVEDEEITTVIVTWNEAQGAARYLIVVTSEDTDGVFIPAQMMTSERSITINNLSHGTAYLFRVRAIGAQDRRSDQSQTVQRIIAPSTVGLPQVTDISENRINLEWQAVKGAIAYIVVVSNTETNARREIRSGISQAQVPSLEAGTVYELHVLSVGAEQTNAEPSRTIRRQTVPNAPENLLVLTDDVTTTSLSLTWQRVKGAASYEVIYSSAEDFDERTFVSNQPNAEIENLVPGTQYQFQVLAVGQERQKGQRNAAVAAATKPEAITSITINGITTNTTMLQWSLASGARFYRLVIENLDDNTTSQSLTTESFATVTELRPGTHYSFNVITIGALEGENRNDAAAIRLQTVPNPPRTFEATEVSTTSIHLIWTATRGVASYVVEVSWNVNGERNERNYTSDVTSLTVTELLAGTRYQLTVRAVSESNLVSARSRALQETTRPDVATNLVVVNVATTSTTLRWGPVKGAQRYVVQYRIRHSEVEPLEVESTATQVTITGLDTGIWYEFVVFSIGARGRRNEDGSPELHLQTVPLAPASLSISNVMTTSLSVSWGNVVGASSYSVRVVRMEDDVADVEVVLTSEESSIEIRNLDSGIRYDVFVTSVGEEDRRSDESAVVTGITLPETPDNLELTQKTTTTADISWSAKTGAVLYQVDLTDSRSRRFESELPTYSFTGLTPGERYTVDVKSVGRNNALNPTASEQLRFQTVPIPPTNIRATSVTSNEIRLTWDESLGVQSYVIRVVSSGVEDIIITAIPTSVIVENLEAGTIYDIYVTSVGDEDQRSAESAALRETTVPSTPQNVQLRNIETSRAELSWDFVKGATSFSLTINSNNTDQEIILQSNENSIIIENLISGGWYNVIIASFGAQDRINPVPSEALVFQTVPLPPSEVVVADVTTDRIEIRWNEVLGARSYLIEYRSNNVNREVRTSNDPFVIRNLLPGTEYSITITTIAQQEGLTSPRSEQITELTRIGAPDTVQYRDESTTSVTLSWEPVQGTSHYVIRATSENDEESYNSDNSETTINNLSPGTLYSFTVTTIDSKERESLSRSATTQVVTVTLPPQNLQVRGLQSRSFVLTWDAPRGGVEYEIVLVRGEAVLTDESTRSTSYTFSGLNPGILYEVSVTALNSNHRSSEPATERQRTVPLPPSSLRVINIEATYLNITWNPVTGGRFYIVIAEDLIAEVFRSRFTENFGVIPRLEPGNSYQITVITETEENIQSARGTTITQQTLTAAPLNVNGLPVNESTISLDWDDVTGASFYTVYYYDSILALRKAASENENVIDGLRSSETVIGGLQSRVNYTFEVTASIGEGLESERSDRVTLETYALSPELPESDEPLVTITDITKTSFVAHWTPILNAFAYIIVIRTPFITDERAVRGGNTSQLVLIRQSPDTDYNVTLKAVGLIGETTDESFPPAQFQTLPLAPPRPFGVRVTKIRATYFEIAWEVMPRAISYDVTILDEALRIPRVIRNVRGNTANVTNLRVLNYYNVSVTSVGLFERSPPSTPVRVQARYPVPVMLRDPAIPLIEVSNINYTSMMISVAPIEHAASYILIIRRNRVTQERLNDIDALTPVSINNLEQNTLYEITYQAVGRGGERSEESNIVRARTRRQIPDIPGNFQVINVGPGEATVLWSSARFAVTYRVNAQNTRTGQTRIFHNSSSPLVIRDLDLRETYNISVASVGKYFDSELTTPITIDIPYPGANPPTGVSFDQVSTTSFRVRWLPAPFAVSYTVIVSELGGRTRIIQFIRRITYRVRDLRPASTYNVTVEAVSHDGVKSTGNSITASTASRESATGFPTTVEPEDLLSSIVQSIVTHLSRIPDSLSATTNAPEVTAKEEDLQYIEVLEERLQQLRNEISKILIPQATLTRVFPRLASGAPRFDFSTQTAFDRLLSLGRELKILILTNDTREPVADSLANRLILTLTELATVETTLSGQNTRQDIRELLFPIVHHELDDVRNGRAIIIINEGNPSDGNETLTIFVRKDSLRSTGFIVNWGRHHNTHRYQITVDQTTSRGITTRIINGITASQTQTLSNLLPLTNYTITIRPVNLNDEIIRGVIGQIRVTTLEEGDSSFNANVTEINYNDVTLTWDRFPTRVTNMIFRIMRESDITVHQQFAVNQAHRSIRFTSLQPGTRYIISVTANSKTYFSSTIQTLVGTPPSPDSTPSPIGTSLVPPSGLRVVKAQRNEISVNWLPVRVRGVQQSIIRYNVKLYSSRGSIVDIRRFIRDTKWIFRGRFTASQYDVTVSSYNFITRRESTQSPRLRVDTRNGN